MGFGGALVFAAPSSADTLFLKNGKSLKINALSCDPKLCTASLEGGDLQVRAADVLRVEPDEQVDLETLSAAPQPKDVAGGERLAQTLDEMVAVAADKYALPKSLVRAVARAESALNPSALSPKGAQGVMQLMPGTAKELGVVDAFDPLENIDAGTRFLRHLLEKYDGRVAEALAAYNAGAGAVARHRGVPPYRETRGYIRKVVKDFEKGEKRTSPPPVEKKP